MAGTFHTEVVLRPADWADDNILRRIYLEAFPPEERRPWPCVRDGGGEPHLLAIDADGRTVGMLSWWNLDIAVYIEHFATDASVRGTGIGTEALRMFIACHDKPLVLEVETPDERLPLTLRRVSFYNRLGLHLLPSRYIQPPYGPGLPPVEMRLMCTDPHIPVHTLADTIHSRVYGKTDIPGLQGY